MTIKSNPISATVTPRRLVSFIPLPSNERGLKDDRMLKLEVQVSLINNTRPTLVKDQDRELFDLWHKVKRSIKEHDIRSHQVTKWFEAVYHTSVSLIDFDRDLPPTKLSKERLTRFYKAIERHTASQ